MRKRRTIIISLLLVAALCLGIGYAGFALDMLISGAATLRGEAPNVVFSTATVTTPSDEEAEIRTRTKVTGMGTETLNINTAGFASVGDKLVLNVTIKNNHNFEVNVSKPTVDLTQIAGVDYFSVTTTWGNTDKVIAANGSETFTLTIELVKDTSDELTQNFTVKFIASQGNQAAATTAAGNP